MGLVSYHKWSLEGTSNFSTGPLLIRWSHPPRLQHSRAASVQPTVCTLPSSSFTQTADHSLQFIPHEDGRSCRGGSSKACVVHEILRNQTSPERLLSDSATEYFSSRIIVKAFSTTSVVMLLSPVQSEYPSLPKCLLVTVHEG